MGEDMNTIYQYNSASPSRREMIAADLANQVHLPVMANFALEIASLVARWSHRARSRRALMDMDARLLRDIGLDQEAALKEAEKPFWR